MYSYQVLTTGPEAQRDAVSYLRAADTEPEVVCDAEVPPHTMSTESGCDPRRKDVCLRPQM